jgi:hypothetical protein
MFEVGDVRIARQELEAAGVAVSGDMHEDAEWDVPLGPGVWWKCHRAGGDGRRGLSPSALHRLRRGRGGVDDDHQHRQRHCPSF